MKAKKRDVSQKRESILTAAMQAFSNEGFDKTSMDRVAEVAAVSKRTVYNHFLRKEDLFQAVVEKFVTDLYSLKRIRYDAARSLEDQLSDFADAELAMVGNPIWMSFMKVLLTVLIRNQELAQATMSRYGTGEDTLENWLRDAVADGKLKVDDPQLAAGVFWAMLGGAFTWPAVYKGNVGTAEKIVALKKELIETFLCRYRKA